jgi:hypothetical protein
MTNSTRSLIGTLTSPTAKVDGFRVEAWDADGICADLIDVALTDARGHFMMQLDADYISNLLPRKEPAIVFRIFDNGKLVSQAYQFVWQIAQELVELQSSLELQASHGPIPPLRANSNKGRLTSCQLRYKRMPPPLLP